MENIFNAKDIREKLKTETELFKKVQGEYKDIVNHLRLTLKGNVYDFIFNSPNKREHIVVKEMIQNLDKIKKEVEKYLDEKRQQFNRFFFLSSDELLDLLSFQDDIDVVADNLKKFFDNIF